VSVHTKNEIVPIPAASTLFKKLLVRFMTHLFILFAFVFYLALYKHKKLLWANIKNKIRCLILIYDPGYYPLSWREIQSVLNGQKCTFLLWRDDNTFICIVKNLTALSTWKQPGH